MAYGNWGSFVYHKGKRRTDKEDVGIFDTDESIFDSDLRIYVNILKNRARDDSKWYNHSHHGVLGDGSVRVAIYKDTIPTIWGYRGLRTKEPISIGDEKFIDMGLIKESWDWKDTGWFEVKEFKKYKFRFIYKDFSKSGHCEAYMIEPNGDEWKCVFDYQYGAGF
jgi:hypothetical protein